MIKLLVEETHSKAFAAFYDGHADDRGCVTAGTACGTGAGLTAWWQRSAPVRFCGPPRPTLPRLPDSHFRRSTLRLVDDAAAWAGTGASCPVGGAWTGG